MEKRLTGNLVDKIKGDKIIWMIVLLLLMLSMLALSSSTSLLANMKHTTRANIIQTHCLILGLCFLVTVGISMINNEKIFNNLGKFGFLISLLALLFVRCRINLGPIRADSVNRAWRVINVFGVQLHIYEFVKLLMVAYMAYALERFEKDDYTNLNNMAQLPGFAFMGSRYTKMFFYLVLPVLTVVVLESNGSNSSAIFILLIMCSMVFISGILTKTETALAIIGGLLFVGLFLGYNMQKSKNTDDEKIAQSVQTELMNKETDKSQNRKATGASRIKAFFVDKEAVLSEAKKDPATYNKLRDKYLQEVSARVAIHEGGITGKGPGQSTQKYVTPVIFADYMYSFIIEEYGLFGAILILILFGSLLAKGSMITRVCKTMFTKTLVGGLVLLITGQALMHIMVNVGFIPMTGQTLPIVSDGKTAALAFSMMFGVILSISKMVKKEVDTLAENVMPIIETEDEIRDGLDELDELESLE